MNSLEHELARRPWAGPTAVAATTGLCCATLLVVDPNEPGRYPTCPVLAVTGRWCPGCGSLRGLRALLGGDVAAAAGFNPLLLLAVPYLVYAWVAWAAPAFGGPAPPALRLPAWVIRAVAGLVVTFGVLRNVPLAPLRVLAP